MQQAMVILEACMPVPKVMCSHVDIQDFCREHLCKRRDAVLAVAEVCVVGIPWRHTWQLTASDMGGALASVAEW